MNQMMIPAPTSRGSAVCIPVITSSSQQTESSSNERKEGLGETYPNTSTTTVKGRSHQQQQVESTPFLFMFGGCGGGCGEDVDERNDLDKNNNSVDEKRSRKRTSTATSSSTASNEKKGSDKDNVVFSNSVFAVRYDGISDHSSRTRARDAVSGKLHRTRHWTEKFFQKIRTAAYKGPLNNDAAANKVGKTNKEKKQQQRSKIANIEDEESEMYLREPCPRIHSACCTDGLHLLVHGGIAETGDVCNDLFALLCGAEQVLQGDPTTWLPLQTKGPALFGHGMTFFPKRRWLVCVGGCTVAPLDRYGGGTRRQKVTLGPKGVVMQQQQQQQQQQEEEEGDENYNEDAINRRKSQGHLSIQLPLILNKKIWIFDCSPPADNEENEDEDDDERSPSNSNQTENMSTRRKKQQDKKEERKRFWRSVELVNPPQDIYASCCDSADSSPAIGSSGVGDKNASKEVTKGKKNNQEKEAASTAVVVPMELGGGNSRFTHGAQLGYLNPSTILPVLEEGKPSLNTIGKQNKQRQNEKEGENNNTTAAILMAMSYDGKLFAINIDNGLCTEFSLAATVLRGMQKVGNVTKGTALEIVSAFSSSQSRPQKNTKEKEEEKSAGKKTSSSGDVLYVEIQSMCVDSQSRELYFTSSFANPSPEEEEEKEAEADEASKKRSSYWLWKTDSFHPQHEIVQAAKVLLLMSPKQEDEREEEEQQRQRQQKEGKRGGNTGASPSSFTYLRDPAQRVLGNNVKPTVTSQLVCRVAKAPYPREWPFLGIVNRAIVVVGGEEPHASHSYRLLHQSSTTGGQNVETRENNEDDGGEKEAGKFSIGELLRLRVATDIDLLFMEEGSQEMRLFLNDAYVLRTSPSNSGGNKANSLVLTKTATTAQFKQSVNITNPSNTSGGGHRKRLPSPHNSDRAVPPPQLPGTVPALSYIAVFDESASREGEAFFSKFFQTELARAVLEKSTTSDGAAAARMLRSNNSSNREEGMGYDTSSNAAEHSSSSYQHIGKRWHEQAFALPTVQGSMYPRSRCIDASAERQRKEVQKGGGGGGNAESTTSRSGFNQTSRTSNAPSEGYTPTTAASSVARMEQTTSPTQQQQQQASRRRVPLHLRQVHHTERPPAPDWELYYGTELKKKKGGEKKVSSTQNFSQEEKDMSSVRNSRREDSEEKEDVSSVGFLSRGRVTPGEVAMHRRRVLNALFEEKLMLARLQTRTTKHDAFLASEEWREQENKILRKSGDVVLEEANNTNNDDVEEEKGKRKKKEYIQASQGPTAADYGLQQKDPRHSVRLIVKGQEKKANGDDASSMNHPSASKLKDSNSQNPSQRTVQLQQTTMRGQHGMKQTLSLSMEKARALHMYDCALDACIEEHLKELETYTMENCREEILAEESPDSATAKKQQQQKEQQQKNRSVSSSPTKSTRSSSPLRFLLPKGKRGGTYHADGLDERDEGHHQATKEERKLYHDVPPVYVGEEAAVVSSGTTPEETTSQQGEQEQKNEEGRAQSPQSKRATSPTLAMTNNNASTARSPSPCISLEQRERDHKVVPVQFNAQEEEAKKRKQKQEEHDRSSAEPSSAAKTRSLSQRYKNVDRRGRSVAKLCSLPNSSELFPEEESQRGCIEDLFEMSFAQSLFSLWAERLQFLAEEEKERAKIWELQQSQFRKIERLRDINDDSPTFRVPAICIQCASRVWLCRKKCNKTKIEREAQGAEEEEIEKAIFALSEEYYERYPKEKGEEEAREENKGGVVVMVEKEKAVLCVQCAARRQSATKDVQQRRERSESPKIEKDDGSSSPNTKEQEQALLCLQCGIRVKLAKDEVERRRVKGAAVLCVQCAVRIRLARNHVSSTKDDRKGDEKEQRKEGKDQENSRQATTENEKEAAALRVQSAVRMQQAKKSVQSKKKENQQSSTEKGKEGDDKKSGTNKGEDGEELVFTTSEDEA